MARTWPWVPLSKFPTAQTLPADVAVTAFRALDTPGLGLGALAHFRPFQCMINVVFDPTTWLPTAQASLAEIAATPARAGLDAGLGLATIFHARPFQRTVMIF